MMTVTGLLCLLTLLCTVHGHELVKRRAKPNTNRAMDLVELHRQCVHHGWSWCSEEIRKMNEPNSRSAKYEKCLKRARAKTVKISPAPPAPPANLSEPLNLLLKPNLSEPLILLPNSNGKYCQTKREHARKAYCKRFVALSASVSSSLYSIPPHSIMSFFRQEPSLRSLSIMAESGCVISRPAEHDLNTTEIVSMIGLWHKDAVNPKRRKCCENLEPPPPKLKNRKPSTPLDGCRSYTGFYMQHLWQRELVSVAWKMKAAIELQKYQYGSEQCIQTSDCESTSAMINCVKHLITP